MDLIEEAILRTVLYADVFNFPLTITELHHFLIHHESVPLAVVEKTLRESELLRTKLEQHDSYVVPAGRRELLTVRASREAASQRLWPLAGQYGEWLACLPFIRMVALTGALAVRNAAHGDDDLDYMLITASGRVWTARACAILLVRLARLRGVTLCPNYVLAETALSQPSHNIFLAHEVVQMVPLFGTGHYKSFRQVNNWTIHHLPNAIGVLYPEPERRPRGIWSVFKRGLEWLLGGRMGSMLENWEYRRKLKRFANDMQKPHSAAQLDTEHVKGHFNDHGHPVLRQYAQRLQQMGLDGSVPSTIGD